jgi:hypothetical protein
MFRSKVIVEIEEETVGNARVRRPRMEEQCGQQ